MDVKKFVPQQIEMIRRTVGSAKAISALSGGVDSAVVTMLGHRAIGSQLTTIFIDDGLMRMNETRDVRDAFKALGIRVNVVNAQDDFFRALRGRTDPEEKRKAFRAAFYDVFVKAVKSSGARFLLQGTIAPDLIETKKGVKTHHNTFEKSGKGSTGSYGFVPVEPLKELFKPDVRAVGKALGLPTRFHQRMPFPGPGLSCRILGDVTPEKVALLQKATVIVEEEAVKYRPFQAFAVLMNDRATGLSKSGGRHLGNVIAVRCIDSKNAITAKPTRLTWASMMKIQDRILAGVPEVTKVLFDLTPKPPSTIEYI